MYSAPLDFSHYHFHNQAKAQEMFILSISDIKQKHSCNLLAECLCWILLY